MTDVRRQRAPLADLALSYAWWALFPPFLVLVVRLSFERACADPYSVLAGVMSNPAKAYAVALLYVAAHGWLLAAYLRACAVTGSLWPSARFRAARGHGTWKMALMLVALAVEYWPVSLWRGLSAAVY